MTLKQFKRHQLLFEKMDKSGLKNNYFGSLTRKSGTGVFNNNFATFTKLADAYMFIRPTK